MLVSPAWAAQGDALQGLGWLGQFLPIILVMGVMYFVVIRPQQKKTQTHQAMLKSLEKGDYVVTNGGLVGVLADLNNENWFGIKIASGALVCLRRQFVVEKVDPQSLPNFVHEFQGSSSSSVAAKKPVKRAKATAKKRDIPVHKG